MKIAEQKGLELLNRLNVQSVPIPIKKIVRDLGIKLQAYNLGDEVSGALVIENGKARIGYNPSESQVRQRFTIAHELGHYLLHGMDKKDDLFVDNVKVMFRRQNATRAQIRQEREANVFAATVLMPGHLIQKELDLLYKEKPFLTDDNVVKEMAATFDVSSIAMAIRLSNLNLTAGK